MPKNTWLWQKPGWMQFTPTDFHDLLPIATNLEKIEDALSEKLNLSLLGQLIANALQRELEASNCIEGITLDSCQLRSSIAKSLGFRTPAWDPERQISGKEARSVKSALSLLGSGSNLCLKDLLQAHGSLERGPAWGKLRDHPEAVYDENGPVYIAPPPGELNDLLQKFIDWWDQKRIEFPAAIGSALAHFIFVTIHPFHDGNGRISRMLAEKALIRNGQNFRLYSISRFIDSVRSRYYSLLNQAQKNGNIMPFLKLMLTMQEAALADTNAKGQRLLAACKFINSRADILNSIEKDIIYEMSLGERQFWTFFEATRYIDNGEAAEKAWQRLCSLGIVVNGGLELFGHAEE